MKPTKENPDYSVVIITLSGAKYEITPLITEISLSHQEERLAMCATIQVVNAQYDGKWLNTLLEVRQRVFIYANDGERHEEVFRGFVWEHNYISGTDTREITLTCYDGLIYLQESEHTAFFPSGYQTEAVLSSICSGWGIPLRYQYESISHGKLALRGSLSDIITSDVLGETRKQTGKRFALLMEQDTLVVRAAGDNSSAYRIESGANPTQTKENQTMEGMVTKVVVLGQSNNTGQTPVEATESGDTEKYGTLQKLQDRAGDVTLSAAKEEAQNTLKEKGKPLKTYSLTCSDIPWIRKGDQVQVNAGSLYQKTLIVWSIERTISVRSKTMVLTMEDPT